MASHTTDGWGKDFLASVVVFMVALPLCMGIAIASGVPVAAGLITGIIGGLVVGTLAGSPLQVSGPAAGLTVIIYDVIQRYDLPALGVVVLIAGAVQLLAGMLRLGQWFRAVSPAVIMGMLSGIGILIFSSQIHVMVDDKPRASGIENLITIPEAIAKGLPIPEWRSQQEREFLANQLKSIGALHEQQGEVQEWVAELGKLDDGALTPGDSAGAGAALDIEVNSVAASVDASVAESLKALAPQQAAVLAHLKDHLAEFERWGLTHDETEWSQRVRDAARQSLAASESALEHLQSGNPEDIGATMATASRTLQELLGSLKNHDWAAKVGLLTILVILLWQALAPKRLRMIPGALIAALVATMAAVLLSLPVLYVEVPDSLWSQIHFPSWAAIKEIPLWGLVQSGLVVAVVASAETLLCATAVDQMHTGQRTQYDRELAAQGVGNLLCGLVGALPMTGVIVRSAANIQAGATTRRSAIMHGVWLLLFVSAFAGLLKMIPTACLAGILVYTGYKLINPKTVVNLARYGWGEVFIYLCTVTVIVVQDLLMGVLTGIVLASLKLLLTVSRLETELTVDAEANEATLTLRGAATFLRLPILAAELERVPPGVKLRVKLDQLDFIDHSCLDLITNWSHQHEAAGGKLALDWDSLQARFQQNRLSREGRNGQNGQSPRPSVSSPTSASAQAEILPEEGDRPSS